MINFDLPFLIGTVQEHSALLIHFERGFILTNGEAYLCFFKCLLGQLLFFGTYVNKNKKKTLKGENVDTKWFFTEKPTWYIWIEGII